jgi:type III secretory pathway component EscT
MAELLRTLLSDPAHGRTLAIAALVAARLAPLTLIAPWIALRQSPAVLRAALLFGLTAALVPIAEPHVAALPEGPIPMGIATLRELVFGAMLAIAASLPLLAFEQSGRLVDVLRGAQGELSGPSGERSSPMGLLSLLLGTTLFLVLGGHRLVIGALAHGIEAVPPGSGAGSAGSLYEVARLLVLSLELAVALAAPALVALFATDVALGLVARSATNIPMHFAGMPLRAAVGLFAVLLSLSLLVPRLAQLFGEAIGTLGALS